MDEQRRKQLETAGWRVGSAAEFLGMTPEEDAYVELKLALTRAFRERRAAAGMTQAGVAARMGSSQSRVAKLEAGEPSVSLDLIVRALLATGASAADLAAAIHPSSRHPQGCGGSRGAVRSPPTISSTPASTTTAKR